MRLLLCLLLVGCGVAAEVVHDTPTTKDADMLPTSRSYPALGPTDPVPSALLLELQDMVIGHKYKELETVIGPYGFQRNASTTAGKIDAVTDTWVGDGVQGFAIGAPLVVAAGTRITRVKVGYARAGGAITMALVQHAINGGGVYTVATFTDNATVGSTLHELAGINHVALAGNAYYVLVTMDPAADVAGSRIRGASYFHDRL